MAAELKHIHHTECVICTENNDSFSVVLSCHHEFHVDCCVEWFRKHRNCPTCRQPLDDAFWKCLVCRNYTYENCIRCEVENNPNVFCGKVSATCRRCKEEYHLHCLQKWANIRQYCPKCSTE